MELPEVPEDPGRVYYAFLISGPDPAQGGLVREGVVVANTAAVGGTRPGEMIEAMANEMGAKPEEGFSWQLVARNHGGMGWVGVH
jgi:hypothetical protein